MEPNAGSRHTGIDSIGDVVPFVMFVPRGVESKVGRVIEIFSQLKILNFSHSFKTIFPIIVVLCLRFAHYVYCSFFNVIPRLDPVGSIFRPSDSGCGDDDRHQFICCVDDRQPKIHEVCIFG